MTLSSKVRLFSFLALGTLIATLLLPAEGQTGAPPNKKAKEEAIKKQKAATIKVLEEQIRQLRHNEFESMKHIDGRYDYIIRNFSPGEIHRQLEESVHVLHDAYEILGDRNYDYGGHRVAAQESVKAAENHLGQVLKHNTPEERGLAAKDLEVAHEDIKKALVYSVKKYGIDQVSPGNTANEKESRATANWHLRESA